MKRRRVNGRNGSKVELIELLDCSCGRPAKRQHRQGTGKMGSPFYQEAIYCKKKSCKKSKTVSAKSPNQAARKWNEAQRPDPHLQTPAIPQAMNINGA